MNNSDILTVARQCLQDEAQAVLDLIPRLDGNFEKAVGLVYGCKGKFVVTGVGKSGHIGSKIAATLASTGTPSFFINPLDAYHGDLGMIQEAIEVFTLTGISVGKYKNMQQAQNTLERGIYVVKSKNRTLKIAVK